MVNVKHNIIHKQPNKSQKTDKSSKSVFSDFVCKLVSAIYVAFNNRSPPLLIVNLKSKTLLSEIAIYTR